MGRWAQRRIRGGGPPPGSSLISITEAHTNSDDVTEVIVTYTDDITAGDFDLTDFEAVGLSENPTTIAQNTSDSLVLTFSEEITTDNLAYTGNVAGVQTPQTVTVQPPP